MAALIDQIVVALPEETKVNLETLKGTMLVYGYTQEMVELVKTELAICKYRFYIGDDSGSMNGSDGKIYKDGKVSHCSRYAEMKSELGESFDICAKAGIESHFISLNSGSIYIKKGGNGDLSRDHQEYSRIFYTPNGGTPLNKVLTGVLNIIKTLPQGERKKIVLYTDGESSDGDITNIIKEIQHYNTSITVRLCTDQESVVTYWDNIDKNLEIRLDIIDSYTDEKPSVKRMNPRLKYEHSMHKLRVFGVVSNDFDRMDEARLTDSQIESLNALLGPVDKGCQCIIC